MEIDKDPVVKAIRGVLIKLLQLTLIKCASFA